MAFLTKKESTLIMVINVDSKSSQLEKENKISEIKYNARLRSDGYRKSVKIFLNVLSNYKNEAIAAVVLK